MIDKKGFTEDRRITLDEIADATGIHRATLSRISNVRGCNTTTDHIESLCRYFECELNELIEFVPPVRKRVPKKG